VPTTDLPVVSLPSVWPLINKTLDMVRANVQQRCNLTEEIILEPNDLFIAKYSAEGQGGLKQHDDGSFISFNLQLSSPDDYEGGGTYFPGTQRRYKLPKGSCLIHGSALPHEGISVQHGTRYIAIGFLGINRTCCHKFSHMLPKWSFDLLNNQQSILISDPSSHQTEFNLWDTLGAHFRSIWLRVALVLVLLAIFGICVAIVRVLTLLRRQAGNILTWARVYRTEREHVE